MTDEVAELVLDNNKAQTLALVIARRQALPMVNVHARYIDVLESEGWLDRELEFLPTDKQIAERQAAGHGLTAPEFAVLIAYTKNANVAEVQKSDLPDIALVEADLLDYFPTELRQRYADAIRQHPLRREIISTRIVNQMVNLSGISFDHRMTEDTGGVGRRRHPGVGRRPARCSTSPACGQRSTRSPATCRSTSSSTCSSTAGGWPSVRRSGCCGTAGRRSTSARRSPSSGPA